MFKIGIYGYGNLGRGVEAAVALNDDTELVGVFTRRDPATVKIRTSGVGVYHTDELEKFKDKIDVLIICGGSATDLPEMTPRLRSISMLSTVLTPTQRFPNILKMLMMPQR